MDYQHNHKDSPCSTKDAFLSEILTTLCQVAEAKEIVGKFMEPEGWTPPEHWYTCPKPKTWSGLLFTYDLWHGMPPDFMPPATGYPTYCRVIRQHVRRVDADVVWFFLEEDENR